MPHEPDHVVLATRPDHRVELATEMDSLVARFGESAVAGALRRLAGEDEIQGQKKPEAEPHKAPSFKECQFCPVTPEDCVDRVEKEKVLEGITDEF